MFLSFMSYMWDTTVVCRVLSWTLRGGGMRESKRKSEKEKDEFWQALRQSQGQAYTSVHKKRSDY